MNLSILLVTPSICQANKQKKKELRPSVIYRSSAQQPCSNKSTHSSRFIHPYVLSFFFLLQVFRPFCQNTWGPGLCRQLSATLVVMRRASLCAGTMTAGASAPRTTHSVIAPRWIWGLWKSVCWKSETPGTWPTKSLRSQVSVFLFFLFQCVWPSHWRQIRPYC